MAWFLAINRTQELGHRTQKDVDSNYGFNTITLTSATYFFSVHHLFPLWNGECDCIYLVGLLLGLNEKSCWKPLIWTWCIINTQQTLIIISYLLSSVALLGSGYQAPPRMRGLAVFTEALQIRSQFSITEGVKATLGVWDRSRSPCRTLPQFRGCRALQLEVGSAWEVTEMEEGPT